jgi:WXXGXW repeat (2 copies)
MRTNIQSWPLLLSTLGLGTIFAVAQPARAEDASQQDGVEVLARGPVHEAFAEPVDSQPQATPVVPKMPPDAIEELPPDQKPAGENVQWVPGYWSWDEERNDFVWVSGFWRVPPPGRQWVPGHWQKAEGGAQWVPGFWTVPEQKELEYVPPPPATLEAGPSVPAPGDDYVYQPGCWVYRESRYAWQAGFWSVHRPGWVWVPAHYVWTPCGFVFVAGYWDLPLADRGLLFAPVYLTPRVYAASGFCWTPCYVVREECLYGALFVRPACGHYYFGDYFGARYERAGYTTWVDFRIGRGCRDPLFSFYAAEHRSTPGWERDLAGVYSSRRSGDLAVPPRTLVEQETIVRNGNRVTSVRNVTVLAPLGDPQGARLQAVAREERLQEQKAARQLQETARQRHLAEAQLVAKGSLPRQVSDPVQHVKLELPAPVRVTKVTEVVRTPPPPPAPRFELKKEAPPPVLYEHKKEVPLAPPVHELKKELPPVQLEAPPHPVGHKEAPPTGKHHPPLDGHDKKKH